MNPVARVDLASPGDKLSLVGTGMTAACKNFTASGGLNQAGAGSNIQLYGGSMNMLNTKKRDLSQKGGQSYLLKNKSRSLSSFQHLLA